MSGNVRNVSFKNLDPKSLPVPGDPRAHRGSRHRKNSDTQFVSRRRIGSTVASPHKSDSQRVSNHVNDEISCLQTSSNIFKHHLFITSFILEFHGSENVRVVSLNAVDWGLDCGEGPIKAGHGFCWGLQMCCAQGDLLISI